MFSFSLKSEEVTPSGTARRGQLTTPHGVIQTPIFMPVGTAGTVKALAPDDLRAAGTQILLGNTYHLMLRPSAEKVAARGGLHKFMGWERPILTDSGGFQVFSLSQGKAGAKTTEEPGGKKAPLAKIDDDGVTFASHLDGRRYRMTPEESMRIQMLLGADIIMAFDECAPGDATKDVVVRAMNRTTKWLARSNRAMTREASRLFGIVQGGIFHDLREEHAKTLTAQEDLFGWAIGGLSVGETKEHMMSTLAATTPHLPREKPRYLMGVGTPEDLLDGIARGIDMFDCVMPTRNARNATMFTSQGKLSIKQARYADDDGPLDPACSCYTCTTFSRAYLRHLFNAGELLFYRLGSLHNVHFYLSLMADARAALEAGRFSAFRIERLAAFARGPAALEPAAA
ncbi:MAG: tRNA guanosine(34) transglycosylase Tgt [Deltaproteobacteria bacterium]|nr:tRNA guanosine(34) transglycosylase Tgt [Deltaproteobacteria bacterium]